MKNTLTAEDDPELLAIHKERYKRSAKYGPNWMIRVGFC